MKKFVKYVGKKIKVSKELRAELESVMQVENFKKGDLIIKEGTYCKKLYFIKKGIVRSYCYAQEKEVTSEFYAEDDLFTSWYSFYLNKHCFDNVEVLEDLELVSITKKDLDRLYDEFPEMNKFIRLLFEEYVAYEEYYTKGFLVMSAKQKYDLILGIYPKIEQRVNLGYIASFLGISQETLSRVRGK